MKKHIPNLITMLNLFCGCVAVIFAVVDQLELAALFVVLGIFFDFFDGLAARLLKVQSDLGVQLDSLADMITSGVVPGIVMFQLLMLSGGWNMDVFMAAPTEIPILPFFGFIITIASGYRLAKFNIDENQTTSFIGLPTPANTLLIISFPLILLNHNNDFLNNIILNPWFLIGMTLLSAYLLNAKIELFAFKFKTWNFKDNALRYIFIVLCVVLLATVQFLAIPAIIMFYVLSSVFSSLSNKK